jgi:hypothetical protein
LKFTPFKPTKLSKTFAAKYNREYLKSFIYALKVGKRRKMKSKKKCIQWWTLLIVSAVALQTATAQFPITIPKISKIKKPKPEQQTPTADNQTNESNGNQPGNDQAGENRTTTLSKDKYADSVALNYHIEEIKKWQKLVEKYDSAESAYLVPDSNDDYLLFAVSPRARDKWFKDFGVLDIRETPNNRLDAALDALAAAAKQKLPLYTPDPAVFKFRDAAAEKIVMGYFKTPANIKIQRTGVGTAGWQIQKDDYGLPSYRYKEVNLYVRDTSDDHPYCHLIYARVKQDYAGGGTYATEIYRSSVTESLVGCPAAMK